MYVALHGDMAHGCTVYTERAQTASVSRGTSHITTKQLCKYTASVDIQKRAIKKPVTHLESHTSAVSLL